MIGYRILGPLEVSVDGQEIDIGGPKLRALLIIPLLRADEPVSRDLLLSTARPAPPFPATPVALSTAVLLPVMLVLLMRAPPSSSSVVPAGPLSARARG
jgi:hypothetical protein